MKHPTTLFILAATFLTIARAGADPQISSWFTAESTRYARVRETDAAAAAGTVTWTGQTLPAYAGVQEVGYGHQLCIRSLMGSRRSPDGSVV